MLEGSYLWQIFSTLYIWFKVSLSFLYYSEELYINRELEMTD